MLCQQGKVVIDGKGDKLEVPDKKTLENKVEFSFARLLWNVEDFKMA